MESLNRNARSESVSSSASVGSVGWKPECMTKIKQDS